MQRLVVVMCLGAAVVGCSDDDGGAKTTPDTALVETPAALSNQGRVRILFEARGNANGFFCTLDANAPVACISPFEADVADGEHTFAVAAALNQNVDETPATHTWRVDTAPPETAILLGPPALDNALMPELTFSSPEADATFECALDGAAFAACTSPHVVTVADGMHTFAVRAKDAAGNLDGSPATHAWTVDATAPDTLITAGPAAGATTAASGTFAFESPDADATFECAIDGAAFTACTSPRAFTLANGDHTFAVRAKDSAGLVDPSPATRAWTVDTVAPTVAITSAPANPSNDATPAFAFDSPDATATFECQIDGVVTFAACTSPFTAPALADGARTFRVRATDPVGNVGTAATHAWVVDTVAPTVTLTTQPAALSADGTPTVAFTTAGAPVAVECAVDAGAFAACTSPFTSGALADGTHTITVRARDAAGNAGTATTSPFAIDTVAPMVAIATQPAALSNDNTPTVTFTTAGNPSVTQCRVDAGTFTACAGSFTPTVADGAHTITVRVADAAGNAATATTASFTVDTVAPTVSITGQPQPTSADPTPTVTFTTGGSPTATECRVDAGAFAACTSPFTSAALADGSHTITVRVTDAATNTASATTSAFTIDTVAPTVTITSEPAALSNDATPTVSFTTAGNPTVTQCRVDAGAFAACTSPFTSAALADGSHTITIRVADAAANAATAATTFTIDTVAPTVAIATQPAALSNDPTATVTFTTGGNPTTTQCQIDAGAFAACTSPFTTAALADGSHTITVRVTDAAGNTASATTSAFTIDTVAPTVTITAQPGALTNDTTPSVSFTTAGNPTTTQCQVDAGAFAACTSPFTSAALANGPHTITIRVADGAGNASTATTGTFTIDTVAPTVTITAQPATLGNDNTPAVSFTTAGGPTTVECRVDSGTFVACTSPHTFGVTADGSHTITVRAIDGAGNIGSATTAAFTIDTTPPVVAFTEQAPASWPVNYFDFRFTVSGQTSISCSLDGGAFAACTSPHTVTVAYGAAHNLRVQASDAAGNTTTVQSATWTPVRGMVLHYPWEQGSTENTSLLRQRPSHSPNGDVASVATFVGGWAGSALGTGTPGHKYPGTRRALASAPDGAYTASFWFRSTNDLASGTIFSNVGATGGVRVGVIRGTALTVEAFENGQSDNRTAFLGFERWVHIALRTVGPGRGLELYVNGVLHSTLATNGFNAGQAPDHAVGPWTGVDIDDLRFFNHAVSSAEICAVLARGFVNAQGVCTPLSPGFEIDFEGEIRDTGAWDLVIDGVQGFSFGAGTLGQLFTLGITFDWGYVASTASFSANVGNLPPSRGRSFTFSFVPGAAFGRLIDFTRQCAVGGPPDLCGISVSYPDNGILQLFVGALGTQRTFNITSTGGLRAGRFNNVVVTEQRDAQGVTQAITVFVNGVKTTIPWGASDIYKVVTNDVRLVRTPGLQVDEYEFWPGDLAQSVEMLCENGSDGEFDVATNTCLLTAGP